MAVLQAYQADLLKDLDQGRGLPPEAVEELRRTTDLDLSATKQTAATSLDGGDGGYGETFVAKPGVFQGKREKLSPRCVGFTFQAFWYIR